MLALVVIACMRTRHLRVTGIERFGRVVTMRAIMIMRHIRRHVCLIMRQIDRLRLGIIGRIIAIIIRRCPYLIHRSAVHIPYGRTLDKDRTHNIIGAIEPAVTHYLHI